jgi:hypothetical protein
MNRQLIFNLRADAPPHLYITAIKKIIDEDGYLHPTMKKLLLVLKKARAPYIILGKSKEIIVSEQGGYLLDRSLNPLTGYSVTYLSDESKKEIKIDKNKYYKNLIAFYSKLGYELKTDTLMNQENFDTLIKNIKFPDKQ